MASKVSGIIEKIQPGGSSGTSYAIASTAYGYCETAAGTAAKVVDMTDFKLYEGVTIHVKFANANSADNPTLNVNSTGAKAIVQYGTTAAGKTSDTNGWYAGAVLTLTYDGTSWVRDQGFNSNSTYSYMRPYGSTASATAAKVGTAGWKFQLTAGKYFMFTQYYDNTAQSALTLNIGSTGAKPIYINGQPSSDSNYTLPGGQYLVYYDGTNYHFRTDDKIPGNIAGDAATVNGLTVQTAVPQNAIFTDTKSFTITANATDGLWDLTGTNGTNAVTYSLAPYSAKGSAASFYTAATNPTLTTRLNYDGYLYATKLYSGGSEVLTAHRTYTAVSGKKPTGNQTPEFGSTFDIEQVGQNTTGQVSVTERTVKIPDTAASTSVAGLINTSAQSFAGIKTFYDHYTNGHIASTTTTAGQYAVIRCTNKGAWMTSFHVRMYTSYESYTLEISGYNYTTNNWHSPKAIMVASTSTSKVTVTFGYDNDAANNYKTLWVAIPIGNYPGIDVQSVVTGHSDTQPRFSVTIESGIPATIQTTVDAYRPWYRNETVSNATTATNLSAKPSFAVSGDNITITAGGKTSDAFTVPYATSAGSATSATTATYIKCTDTRNTALNPTDLTAAQGVRFDFKAKGTINLTATDAYAGVMSFRPYASNSDWSGGNAHQLAFNSEGLHWRSGGASWGDWCQILDDNNFNLYAPTLTGTGASGSWGISITGTAAKAIADASGNTITSTYAPLNSPDFSGIPTANTAANGTNTRQIATTEFVNNTLSYINAMQFKGTLGTGGTVTALPASHEAGDTYRVITPGIWAGKYCEEGTLIICIEDGTVESADDWTSVETNEDGAVIGPSTATDNGIVLFSGNTGRIIKDSSKTLTTTAPSTDSGDTTIPTSKAVWTTVNTAITGLDVAAVGGDTGEYISKISQTDGKISATKATTSVSNTWTAGTTAGPTIKTTVNGITGTAVAIPSASNTASGVITTGDQTFAGIKTFANTTASTSTDTGAVLVSGGLGVTGQVTAARLAANGSNTSYNLYVNGTSYLNGNTTVNGNLIPGANNTKTLGSTSARWSKLYIGSADDHGDAYTPIYWNDGVPTAVIPVQYCEFTISESGKTGVRLSHTAFTNKSYVLQIVITSGESNLNSAISWTSNTGYIDLTCSATSGAISGYILVSRGDSLTGVTQADLPLT